MDEFTFKSNAFKLTILFIISVFLSSDFITLTKVFLGEYVFHFKNPLLYLILVGGLLLKIAILVSTLSLKGPLRSLLYAFGGVLVIGALAHFIEVWTGGANPASPESMLKLLMLSVGFVLVLPAGQAIQHAYDP